MPHCYDCAVETKGVVIKSERDTFVCVFEQRHLVELEEGKFKILDTIKELNSHTCTHRVHISISMPHNQIIR